MKKEGKSRDDIIINHYSGNEYERTAKLFLKSFPEPTARTESITLNQIKVLLHFHPRPLRPTRFLSFALFSPTTTSPSVTPNRQASM